MYKNSSTKKKSDLYDYYNTIRSMYVLHVWTWGNENHTIYQFEKESRLYYINEPTHMHVQFEYDTGQISIL